MPGWLKSCAIGCGLIVVLVLVLFLGCGYTVMKPYKEAIDAREELATAHADQESYRPPLDGAVASGRVEAFLAVRERLRGPCAEVGEVVAYFEGLDDRGEMSAGEKIGVAFGVMKRVVRMPAALGEYARARNRALLAEDMGLGEYTYVYAMAYYGLLGEDVGAGNVTVGDEEVGDRVRRVLRGMLRRQLEDLRADGSRPDLEAAVREEILRLDAEPEALPWDAGLPETVRASLDPFRDRLGDSWCPGAAPFDLVVNREGDAGFSIHAE